MHKFMQWHGFYALCAPPCLWGILPHTPIFARPSADVRLPETEKLRAPGTNALKKSAKRKLTLVVCPRVYYNRCVEREIMDENKNFTTEDNAEISSSVQPADGQTPQADVLTADAESGTATAAVRKDNVVIGFLKSVLGIGQPDDRVPGGEKISYYAYFAGQNLIYTLVATYLTTFALLQGMDAGKVALVLVLVKVWDAFNDAIFGALFDKIKFKSGNKFLPWLRMSVVAIPLSVILLFAIPAGISEAGQLAWLAIAYLIHDCVYTLCDAPIHGCITVLTDNFGEREKMLSVKSICGTAGSGIASLLAMVLVSQKVGVSYLYVAIIGAVIAFATMLPFCFKGKERVVGIPPEESFTVRRMFRYLFSNKYLLIYYTAFLFSSGCNVLGSLQLFMSFYVFNDELIVLYVGLITTVPFAVASFAVPYILKKVNKITLYKSCLLATVGINLLIFFFARGNTGAYIGLSVVNAIATGVVNVLMFMFTPDCAEYGRFKTGIEAKGITFSLQTLMAKITGAISGSLGLAIIGLFGWQSITAESFADLAELAKQGITQSAEAIDGLWIACILVPLIGNFIAFLILQFYRLKDSDVKTMMRCNAGELNREEALAQIKCKL